MAGTVTLGQDPTSPLLERDRELEALTEAISAAAEGRGSILIVEGPAGIGKTRILAEAATRAQDAGFVVRSGRGGEMERDMPFGVARQLFETLLERATDEQRDAWLSGSARHSLIALGMEPATSSAIDVFTPINGLYWLVANLSETRPVILVIDDAHWSDADSLRFASFLTRRIADLRVCLVIGSRTGETDEPQELNALRLEASSLRPEPLSEISVRELIVARTGQQPSEDFAAACAQVTGGNPYLVVEITRELASGGGEMDAAATDSIAQLVPDGVARAVLFRLSRFGDEAIAICRAIAVLGRAPQFRYIADLVGISEDSVVTLCDRLSGAEILAPGLPLDFVHPLVRQAIYKELSEGERSSMHRRAAEVLDSFGADAQEIAAHLLACAPNGDEWVVDHLRVASDKAARDGALDGVVRYLERALEEPPRDPGPLLNQIGRALVETDPFRAPMLLVQALEFEMPPAQRVETLSNLVWALATSGNLVGAADRCDEALAVAGHSDRELRLALEAQSFFLRSAAIGADPVAIARMEDVAGELSGDTPGERVARQGLVVGRFLQGAPVQELVDLALPFPPLPWVVAGGESFLPLAMTKILGWCGYWSEARAELIRWIEQCHRDGRVAGMSAGESFMSEVERSSGRLAESEALASTACEIADLVGGRFTTFGWSAFMNLAASLLARGDLTAFEDVVGDFDLSMGPLEIPVNPWPIEIRAHYRLAKGELEPALQDFLEIGEKLARLSWLHPLYPPWRQEAAEILVALGRKQEATEVLAPAEDRLHDLGSPQFTCSVLRARALTEPRKRAIETLHRSVEAIEKVGPPHELARSLIELGAALRRNGQRNAARQPLQRALELAHRSGAGLLEARAREELAAVGFRPRQAYSSGPGSLTASELRIARLAADGLNNREIAERLFVTRRTIETHLTHAYEKLGIEGRGDLTAALSEPVPASS